MDSSPGFASAACDSIAILKARFHCGSVQTLTSPHTATRWLILQKARRHPARGLRLLVGARFQVLFHSPLGVLFTFPSRYWFAIGHRRVFSLGGWSPLLPTGFHVPGGTRVPPTEAARVRVRGSHPVPPAFPGRSASAPLSDSAHGLRPVDRRSRNPHAATPSSYELAWVWAGPVSLAATPGISVDFSSSGYLDVSVPRVASSRPIGSGAGSQAWPWLGFPIREPPDRRPFAPPRGLSQLAAPFVDFLCQGIRRAPLTSSRTFSMGIHIETSRSF